MTESQLKSKVKKMIREEFPDVWAQKICDRFTSGLPDMFLCCWGIFVVMEGKTPQNKKKNPLQDYTLERIRRAGGVAGKYHNVEEARQMILEARERAEKIR